jgi:hypothetical protein
MGTLYQNIKKAYNTKPPKRAVLCCFEANEQQSYDCPRIKRPGLRRVTINSLLNFFGERVF